jgi:hypothetical protein
VAHAQQILDQQRAALAAFQATAAEVDATALRVDALRKAVAETSSELASLPEVSGPSLPDLLEHQVGAELRAEHLDARLRRSAAFEFRLSGGYDRIYGVEQKLPLHALVSMRFDLGWFFQRGADRRAAAAREASLRGGDPGATLDRVVHALHAQLDAARVRLTETGVLLTDLEARLRDVSAISGTKARGYADLLWFDAIRIRAEHAYFEAHVAELERVLGDPEAP